VDKLDFRAFLGAAGAAFQAEIERAAYYHHPTGTGDAREDAVRRCFQEVLSPRFSVDRGKVFDSQGNLSKEFDIIIAERDDTAPAMRLAGRRIVPIEAVYGIIEVKSRLTKDAYESFIEAVVELDSMKRFYKPKLLSQGLPREWKKGLEEGFPPQDRRVGLIWSGIIAFEAPTGKTINRYLSHQCEGFWFVCIPGKELIVKWIDPPGWRGPAYGLHALPLIVWQIMVLASQNPRLQFLTPDFARYRSAMVSALGDVIGWTAH